MLAKQLVSAVARRADQLVGAERRVAAQLVRAELNRRGRGLRRLLLGRVAGLLSSPSAIIASFFSGYCGLLVVGY